MAQRGIAKIAPSAAQARLDSRPGHF